MPGVKRHAQVVILFRCIKCVVVLPLQTPTLARPYATVGPSSQQTHTLAEDTPAEHRGPLGRQN